MHQHRVLVGWLFLCAVGSWLPLALHAKVSAECTSVGCPVAAGTIVAARPSTRQRHQTRSLLITNKCPRPIWVASLSNQNVEPLPDRNVKLAPKQSHTYHVPAKGWAGRFWPKTGCDDAGSNCAFGESIPPCPTNGCHPPAETKVEFLWPSFGEPAAASWYDISLVDGYSLPVQIMPIGKLQGSCVTTMCQLSLDRCPTDEIDGLGDLRVIQKGEVVACLSPCKRWNTPQPYGMGRNERDEPGILFCCPTPPIQPQECSRGPVIHTKYVRTVRDSCATAYSYAYDDTAGLHACPADASFAVTFCP